MELPHSTMGLFIDLEHHYSSLCYLDLVYVLQKKDNMKILHLISSLDKGGAENHLALLASQQVKNNVVMIVYLKGNDYWKKKT